MNVDEHQRCENCGRYDDPGCMEYRHGLGEAKRALGEMDGRAARHSVKLPPVEIVAWCPAFWRRGRAF